MIESVCLLKPALARACGARFPCFATVREAHCRKTRYLSGVAKPRDYPSCQGGKGAEDQTRSWSTGNIEEGYALWSSR